MINTIAMKKDYKQSGTANPLKQGQIKVWLIVLLSVFCTCVSFAQMPTIKQGPLAKGVKLTNQALYIGEDESCYYFFDYYSKITLVSFDKTDLSLKTEKDFKRNKMSMRLLIYGGIYGENIEVLTVKHEAKGYRLEKLTFKKSDMTLTSTEDLGFSPFEDGKKHFSNMDPVKLKEMLTVSHPINPIVRWCDWTRAKTKLPEHGKSQCWTIQQIRHYGAVTRISIFMITSLPTMEKSFWWVIILPTPKTRR